MNQEITNSIMYQMNQHLDNEQLMELKKVLMNVLDETDNSVDDSFDLLNHFIATKRLEGRSEKTLKYYRATVEKVLKKGWAAVIEKTVDDFGSMKE